MVKVRMRSNLERLTESGMVEAVGNGRGRAYILSAKVYKDPAKYVRQTDIDKLPELIRKLAKSRGSYHEKRCGRTFASITTTGVPYSTENAGRRGNCTRRQHSCSSVSYRSKR